MRTAKEIFNLASNKMKQIEPTKVLTAYELVKDADEAFVVSEMNRIKKEMRAKSTRLFFIWSGWGFSVDLFKDEKNWDNILEDLERELENTQDFDDEGNIRTLNREEAENQLEKEFRVFMLLYMDYHVFNQRLKELQAEKQKALIAPTTDTNVAKSQADIIKSISALFNTTAEREFKLDDNGNLNIAVKIAEYLASEPNERHIHALMYVLYVYKVTSKNFSNHIIFNRPTKFTDWQRKFSAVINHSLPPKFEKAYKKSVIAKYQKEIKIVQKALDLPLEI